MSNKKIKVAEMFAGVGGFHLALREASNIYEVVWANQWEPERKAQFAYDVYVEQFGKKAIFTNEDISTVDLNTIPDIDMIVGGFPCQDYSVAHSGAEGITGKKGVLWWDVHRMVKNKKPKYLLLENVDRLLTSPGVRTEQPGRDFGMMLRTLNDAGYVVQWRMINAADYGFPQRRRRTFIFAFRNDMPQYKTIHRMNNKYNSLTEYNPFCVKLPVQKQLTQKVKEFSIVDDELVDFSNHFNIKNGFKNTGTMIDGIVYSAKTTPDFHGYSRTLGDVIDSNVARTFYLTGEQISKMKYLKGAKDLIKTRKHAPFIQYRYAEGAIAFPDSLDKPSRTMVTSEHSISRMSHIVASPGPKDYRRLTPEETEKLNTFPVGWTSSIPLTARYFTMGNALVVGLVREIAKGIIELIEE